MPPRYAYWTILIDGKPTAFRAAKQEELLPTLAQLRRTNPVIEMKWFARGKLWDSQEQSQWAGRNARDIKAGPPRDREWRPGGEHKDPRARFDKHKKKHRPHSDRPRDDDGVRPPAQAKADTVPPRPDQPGAPPRREKAEYPPRSDRPWSGAPRSRPAGPWERKPGGPPRGDRPWSGKPKGDRPWNTAGRPPRDERPWSGKPKGDRPWNKTGGPPRDERPWSGKPAGASRGDRPWQQKSQPPRGDRPWSGKPGGDERPGRPKPQDGESSAPKNAGRYPPAGSKPRGGMRFPPKRRGGR